MTATASPAPSADRYADWKAPREDGASLVWPEPARLLAETRENIQRLSNAQAVRIQNVPLPELRSRARAFVGHADDDRPLVMTGHQCELHHAGVWVKNVVIDAIAGALNGAAFHLSVDTDSPKHLILRWPGGSGPITDDPARNTATWSGLLASPTPAHLNDLAKAFDRDAAGWPFVPSVRPVLESLRHLAIDPAPLPQVLTHALHEFDWSLGLRHHALLASPLWMSPPFLLFAHHLLAGAGAFARDYNAALAGYRRKVGITSTMRPMPDLFNSDAGTEAPFWLDNLSTGERRRPSVFDDGAGGTILELLDGQSFRFDPAADGFAAAESLRRWLAATNHRLSPRALILTLFSRLCLADQFVHGIGGGRYDQVTDRLIHSHFGIDPPRFSVATATLFFPTAVGRERACVPCLVLEGHQLRHALPGDEKRRRVDAIAAMPRRSVERSRAFADLHARLREQRAASTALPAWEQRLDEARKDLEEDQTIFDRELFYVIQPRDRLERLIEAARRGFGRS